MSVGPRPVLPRIAPVNSGRDHDQRRLLQRGVVSGGIQDHLPEISRAQLPQSELGRAKVIHARLEPGQVLAHQIQLDLVQRGGARRRPKNVSPPGNFLLRVTPAEKYSNCATSSSVGTFSPFAFTPWLAIADSADTPLGRNSRGSRITSSVG